MYSIKKINMEAYIRSFYTGLMHYINYYLFIAKCINLFFYFLKYLFYLVNLHIRNIYFLYLFLLKFF